MEELNLTIACFIKTDTNGAIVEWPLSSWEVAQRVGQTNIDTVNSKDWGEYKRVFVKEPPAPSTFTKVVSAPPQKTGEYYFQVWDVVSFSNEEIMRTLQAAKAAVNDSINQARLDANNGFFMYNDKKVACDQLSRSDIDGMNGLVQITKVLPENWIGYWKAMDNTRIPITTYNEWVGFYSAMYAQGMRHFAHSQYLKGMLELAQTLDAINAISWSTETPYLKTE